MKGLIAEECDDLYKKRSQVEIRSQIEGTHFDMR